jgi:acyl-coenzyme A thioesterase PaaI-like protein
VEASLESRRDPETTAEFTGEQTGYDCLDMKESDNSPSSEAPFVRAWADRKPGQLIGKGHPAGDFLEAYAWEVLEEGPGLLRIRAHLPEHVRNPRGQLFGGFTPTYVDLVALFTVRAGTREVEARFSSWLATTNMRVDYFEPILGPEFIIDSRLIKKRGRTNFVETRFLDLDGELAVFAVTTMREVSVDRSLGDG